MAQGLYMSTRTGVQDVMHASAATGFETHSKVVAMSCLRKQNRTVCGSVRKQETFLVMSKAGDMVADGILGMRLKLVWPVRADCPTLALSEKSYGASSDSHPLTPPPARQALPWSI